MLSTDALLFFRRQGISTIASAEDLSVWLKEGFVQLGDAELSAPGGKVTVYLFDSEAEMNAFESGMEAGIPGDAVSWILQADDESETYVMIVHDSSDDANELDIIDHRVPDRVDVETVVNRLIQALNSCVLRLSVNAPANNLDVLHEAREAVAGAKEAGFGDE